MPKTQVAATAANPVNGSGVGRRLRSLRKERNLSVNELALKAGVSSGMVSQIERSLANPSIRMLERLRHALGVPLTAFLEDSRAELDAVDDFVRRADDRPIFQVGPNGLTKELLSPHGDHDLQFMMIVLPAGTSSEEVLIGIGEKAGLVLEGCVSFQVGARRSNLCAGDSFQFKSTLPHSVHNTGDKAARILWIMNTKAPVIHL